MATYAVGGYSAAEAAVLVEPADRLKLIEAAWLHDIGYGDSVAVTGFHPLNGARHLRGGYASRPCRLVAHHSASLVEAEERGLVDELLTDFPPEWSAVADMPTFADMTTSPR